LLAAIFLQMRLIRSEGNAMTNVCPHLSVLSPDQIEQVHAYSLNILANTGIRVESPQAREIFARHPGCSCKSDRVFLPAQLVEDSIKSSPSSVDIYDRLGKVAFSLDSQDPRTYFGVGVTNLWYQDPQTDQISPFSRQHMEIAVRLAGALPEFDVVSTPGVIQDIASNSADLYGALEMVANTTKPLVLLISNFPQFKEALSLLSALTGDLSARPFVIPYFNPVTPLVLNTDTSDKMILTVESGLPFIYSSYGMSGATAPITAAGTLALLNAELLAGLVFAQLLKKGTPVILGHLPSFFEMKSMISAYTPQSLLLNLACAEMMAHYAIPHSGTSGSGTGWGPDLIAGGTLWMNHLTSCLGKAGLLPFVGGNLDSLAFSPTTVIYANEIIRQCRLFCSGFSLDDSSVALAEINEAALSGSFLMSGQTLALFRQMHKQHSLIWPGLSLDKWQAEKSPAAIERLRAHCAKIMDNLQAPADHDEIIAKGEAILKGRLARA
jgi:trimethylamine---corrinoid protein Co-methyltransferase